MHLVIVFIRRASPVVARRVARVSTSGRSTLDE
jgi:hypothetical protein